MKKLIILSIVFLSSFTLVLAQQIAKNDPSKKRPVGNLEDVLPGDIQSKADMLVMGILNNYHYRKIDLNDSLSSIIYDRYLDALDPNKMFFLFSDVKSFEKYRYELDDALQQSNLVPAYYIFNIFKRRYVERSKLIPQLLEKEFDYTVDENYDFDHDKMQFAKTNDEVNDIWRKFIKNQALSLKLNHKTWVESSKVLRDRFDRQTKNILQMNTEDVFQIYMNAYAGTFDPHTDYFSPVAADEFKQDVTLSFEGIGASLINENDYVKVADVIPGGPAFKSKLLQKGDRIVGVAQGDTGKVVDIVGWRTQDAVKLIKGKKGTIVRLHILPASAGENALTSEIKIVRDKVKLEEQSAKKTTIEVKQKDKTYKYGVITVPGFYLDYEGARKGETDYKSTTRDVKKLITELQAEKIDGLILDLRFNGGGSLQEAVSLTGLFIPKGPVVQVRDSKNKIEVEEDEDPEQIYAGPLAILVNRFSASASEIFAGAIQDYKRGVIIGEQTYGKGTVQQLLDLNQFMPSEKEDLGQVKVTLAKFYRVTGSSTQLKGVTPDVQLPSAYSAEEFGETSQPSALPWDFIVSSKFVPSKNITDPLVSDLNSLYRKRLESNGELKVLAEEIEDAKSNRNTKSISLLESRRQADQTAEEKKIATRNALNGIPDAKSTLETDSAKESKDVYLNETGNILTDAIKFDEKASKTKKNK